MARTSYFETAVTILRRHALAVSGDTDTVFAGCWPEREPFPELEPFAVGIVGLSRSGYRDVGGIPCRRFRLADTGAERAAMRAAGVDDYFETHAQDDLQDFSDNEAWADMQGDLD